MGTIPDGLYETFGDTLRIVGMTPRSAASLQRLAEVLRSAQEQRMDREATAAAIEQQAPEFADLANDVRQRTGWSLHQYLVILLMVIQILIAAGGAGGLTDQQVEHLFQQFVQAHPVLAPTPTATPALQSTAQPTPSVRPNDPCLCGSGKTYRYCHGAPARSSG
jgi:SEC-C motif